jgi:UDP-N-acetylglucosamine 4,6-dehydratase
MTGGAGFLGRGILRWAASAHPDVRFTIFSRDEAKHSPVRQEFPQHNFVIGDVCDKARVTLAMAGHDVVIHAAAFKYVPQAEINVAEAINVNVTGSRNVAEAALMLGVKKVIGISTDKACQPVNVYGLTKLLMERLFQEADTVSSFTNFNLVRYGNVLSSTGSVVPLFRQQARAGHMTVTNRRMTRFWLSVDEAVHLIDLALREIRGGTILIPRLHSAEMETVAIACKWLEVGPDAEVEIEDIGQRFGEKVHESLLTDIETVYAEWYNETIYRLYPVTEGPRQHFDGDHGNLIRPYTSERFVPSGADGWYTVDEFVELIKAAPE